MAEKCKPTATAARFGEPEPAATKSKANSKAKEPARRLPTGRQAGATKTRDAELVEAEIYAVYGAGAAGGFVHVNLHSVHLHVAFGYREFCGERIEEALHDGFFLHADDGIVGAGHAYVGDIGSAAGENAIIGGGDVGVRAQDGGDFAVEMPAHGLFFGSGFGVHVHDDHLHIGRERSELAFGGAKGIFQRRHEGAALQIHYRVGDAIFSLADEMAFARGADGKIRGADQPRLVREKIENLLAVPDVIAAGDDFRSGREYLFGEARSDAETGCSLFAVGDAQVYGALRDDIREAVMDDFASGRADNISDKENLHAGGFSFHTSNELKICSCLAWSGPLRRAQLGPEPHE